MHFVFINTERGGGEEEERDRQGEGEGREEESETTKAETKTDRVSVCRLASSLGYFCLSLLWQFE